MTEEINILESIQVRRHLEEINHFVLHDEGEIVTSPGKISLVWTDSTLNIKRFLAVKLAGGDLVLINGRRYPATEAGLQQGLIACLATFQ